MTPKPASEFQMDMLLREQEGQANFCDTWRGFRIQMMRQDRYADMTAANELISVL